MAFEKHNNISTKSSAWKNTAATLYVPKKIYVPYKSAQHKKTPWQHNDIWYLVVMSVSPSISNASFMAWTMFKRFHYSAWTIHTDLSIKISSTLFSFENVFTRSLWCPSLIFMPNLVAASWADQPDKKTNMYLVFGALQVLSRYLFFVNTWSTMAAS